MNMEHNSASRKAYGIFALGIVPISTFLFACQGDLITTNLSQLGNRPGQHSKFVLWGILCAGSLYMLFHRAFEMTAYKSRIGKGLLTSACASFLACVVLPFVPQRFPLSAKWHNRLAMLATVLTVIVSALLTLHLRKISPGLCIRCALLLALQIVVCWDLLTKTGISGLVEAVFISATCIHTYHVMRQLEKYEGVMVNQPVAFSVQEAEGGGKLLTIRVFRGFIR